MNIYRNIAEIDFNRETVITIGTFDGVHKGHQSVLRRLREISASAGLRNFVVTFDPHPQIVLNKDLKNPVFLLTSMDERLQLFAKEGIDNVLIINFTEEFANTRPEIFINDFLVQKIGLTKILVGYDHLFGRNREGNHQLLSSLGREFGFELESVSAFEDDLIIVSSTKIRKMLRAGNLESANTALGYNYFVSGKVVIGDRRGHTIGYPTANIQPTEANKLLPLNGVYLVKSSIHDKVEFGMANLGLRPTFTNNQDPVLEVFFFDFNEDIYDEILSVSFLKYIRQEQKFPSLDDFIHQLEKDEINCRKFIPEFYY